MQTLEVMACDDTSLAAEDLEQIAMAASAVPPEKKDGGSGVEAWWLFFNTSFHVVCMDLDYNAMAASAVPPARKNGGTNAEVALFFNCTSLVCTHYK